MTSDAPSHEELLPLVAAAASVADHGSLRPWRLIEIRGEARERLGAAFAAASGADPAAAEKVAAKTMRASLLIAVVASIQPNPKVQSWEQEAAASGVAHALSLLLDDAGWGVMWRSGHFTRTEPVRSVHRLAENEQLLGWLYVGGIGDSAKVGPRRIISADDYLTVL